MEGVVILGGGLAGLGCAQQIPQATIYEAAKHPGGHAYSHPVDGICWDQGAHISHSRDEQFIAMTKKSAGDIVEICPSIVRNYADGRWLPYPIQNYLSSLGIEECAKALTDLISAQLSRPETFANYGEWCRSQYGRHLAANYYDRFTRKYWRIEMEDLATDWLAGRLIPPQLDTIIRGALGAEVASQAVFAKFRYPRRAGFFGLFSNLYADVNLQLGQRAVSIDLANRRIEFESGKSAYFETLASSIPLTDLIQIIVNVPSRIREAAGKLRHTQLTTVNLIVNRPSVTDAHWFYVYDEDIEFSRVSIPSNLSPESAPAGTSAFQMEVFRGDHEQLPSDAIIEGCIADLGSMLDFDPVLDIKAVHHRHTRHAYIVSDHQRAACADEVLNWLDLQGIYSMGLYGRWNYIWSDVAFKQGLETGARIKEKSCSNRTA